MALRFTLLLVAALALPASAGAVTLRDIIELSKAGLPDDVLMAVIEADRTIFTLDTQQILQLKKAGVSKAVLLKMLRSRREFEEPQPPLEETGGATTSGRATSRVATPVAQEEIAPHVVIIGGAPTPPPVTVVVPQQYYYVPFPLWGRPAPNVPPAPFLAPEHRGFGRFINDGWRP
jgi:hypothetical protein